MQMNEQTMSRKGLLDWINQVSFAVSDILLYLDSHPCDEDALAYFREKSQERNRALAEYARNYGPLTIDTADDNMSRSWEWVQQPWPWEPTKKGGCR